MISLPYPISANRYWRVWRGRPVLSSEARAYKTQAAALALLAGFSEPLTGAVELCIQLHPRLRVSGKGKAGGAGAASLVVLDLTNSIKVMEDALQGVCYVNDKQVKRISAEYGPPMEGGGLSVWVGAIQAGDTSSVCPVQGDEGASA